MGGLIGPAGGLEELKCASGLSKGPEGDTIVARHRTVDGTKYVQVAAARPARVWNVDVGTATPAEMQMLEQLQLARIYDRQPMVYYDEACQLTNMLDPEASMMQSPPWTKVTPSGARVQPGLSLPGPRSLTSAASLEDGTWAHLSNVPVPYLRTVTCSVYLTAHAGMEAHFWVDELTMDGRTLPLVHKTKTAVNAVRERVSLTFETTGETVALTFGVSRAVRVTMPALTLTDAPADWAPGGGCMNASFTALPSQQVQLAVPGVPWGQRSSYSWQVEEIGRAGLPHGGVPLT